MFAIILQTVKVMFKMMNTFVCVLMMIVLFTFYLQEIRKSSYKFILLPLLR